MEKVFDSNGVQLKPGMVVSAGTDARGFQWFGTVRRITDPDGDLDDEGRTIGIPPYVIVEGDQPLPWEDSFSCDLDADPWDLYMGADADWKCDELQAVAVVTTTKEER
jgi:hypothetical protein